MSFEAMASDIARRYRISLSTLRRSGRHKTMIRIRREVCATLVKAGATHAEIGRILGRHPSIVHSLMHPVRHRRRCKVYIELRRLAADERESRDNKPSEDEPLPRDCCRRCGLRGEHVCLTGDATRRLEVEW